MFLMLFARKQTIAFAIMLQFIHQSYNAIFNYGNRNASSKYTVKDIIKAYIGAVLVSGSIAIMTRTYFGARLSTLRGSMVVFANAGLNFLATAAASATNVTLMRSKELRDGIKVRNKRGDVTYGLSKQAARKAVFLTSQSRMIHPLPTLFFPALANFCLEKVGLWPAGLAGRFLELSLTIASLTFAIPMSVALYD